ncbi:MAG: hypothetical protein B7Y39_02150 [Bdellovibrio sp. 28-41-41]|nr:MAG: hypothetical protein B7Y39_02150 [Bdellovibrio sp. 28-41-41]
MKQSILTIVLILSLKSFAYSQELTFKSNLSASYEADISETDDYKGGTTECNPTGSPKTVTYNTTRAGRNSNAGNGTFSGSGQTHYELYQKGSESADFLARKLDINFATSLPTSRFGQSSGEVTLQDWVSMDEQKTSDHDCRKKIMKFKYARSVTDGTLTFEYKVPSDIWLLNIKLDATDDLLAADPFVGDGALFSRTIPSNGVRNYFVWSQPGSIIKIIFKFNQVTPGRGLIGKSNFSILPVISSNLNDDQFADAILSSLNSVQLNSVSPLSYLNVDNMDVSQKIFSDIASQSSRTISDLNLISNLSRILSSVQIRQKILKRMSLSQIKKLMNDLHSEIVMKANTTAKSEDILQVFWEKKAMGSLASFVLAQEFLNQMTPYCENIRIETPVKGEYRDIQAIKAVWFYLSQAKSRIEYYKFSNYRAIFAEIRELEKAGKTYDQVMSNKILANKLRRSFEVLSLMDLSKLPFKAAAIDLKFVTQKFPGLTTEVTPFAPVLQKMEDLAKMETPFAKSVMLRFSEFRLGNNKAVKITDLDLQLDQLEMGQEQVKVALPNAIPFLSLNANSYSSLNVFFHELTSRHVNLLLKPLEDLGVDGKVLTRIKFEKIRKAFVETQNPNGTTAGIQKCSETNR